MATSYLTPGVYVEETPPGSRPIEGVGTSVAAFVGFAEMGPRNRPVLVTNWSQYQNTFGGYVNGYYLPHSVYGYFANGGGTCFRREPRTVALATNHAAAGHQWPRRQPAKPGGVRHASRPADAWPHRPGGVPRGRRAAGPASPPPASSSSSSSSSDAPKSDGAVERHAATDATGGTRQLNSATDVDYAIRFARATR